MAPMAGHGRRIDALVDLVKALLRHQGRDWDRSHPVTLRRLREAEAEPDACFYIQNWQAVLGKERIDLATDPPPDLAIEMDLTSVTELDVYQMLACPQPKPPIARPTQEPGPQHKSKTRATCGDPGNGDYQTS